MDNLTHIYVDGACSCNPGPAGIGIVLIYKDHKKEISKFIGESTNNIAELTAIKVGLESIKEGHRDKPTVVYTDSAYCHGLLTKDWKAKKNIELVMELRSLVAQFNYLGFKKVKGHANNLIHNRADELATTAIKENCENGFTG